MRKRVETPCISVECRTLVSLFQDKQSSVLYCDRLYIVFNCILMCCINRFDNIYTLYLTTLSFLSSLFQLLYLYISLFLSLSHVIFCFYQISSISFCYSHQFLVFNNFCYFQYFLQYIILSPILSTCSPLPIFLPSLVDSLLPTFFCSLGILPHLLTMNYSRFILLRLSSGFIPQLQNTFKVFHQGPEWGTKKVENLNGFFHRTEQCQI